MSFKQDNLRTVLEAINNSSTEYDICSSKWLPLPASVFDVCSGKRKMTHSPLVNRIWNFKQFCVKCPSSASKHILALQSIFNVHFNHDSTQAPRFASLVVAIHRHQFSAQPVPKRVIGNCWKTFLFFLLFYFELMVSVTLTVLLDMHQK